MWLKICSSEKEVFLRWNHLTTCPLTLGNKQFPNSTEEPLEISSSVHWRLRGIISFSLRKTQTVSSRRSQKSYIYFLKAEKKKKKMESWTIRPFAILPSWEMMLNSQHWTLITLQRKKLISGRNGEYQKKKCSHLTPKKASVLLKICSLLSCKRPQIWKFQFYQIKFSYYIFT